jgi:hypothetical protein
MISKVFQSIRPSFRHWIAALLTLVLVATGIVAARVATAHYRRAWAMALADSLRSERAEVRRVAAEQLRELGDDGIASLTQALLDEREDVFLLATSAIDASLHQWQFLPVNTANERLECLARELERIVGELPPGRRHVTRRWSELIVTWPTTERSRDTSRILLSCESILRQSSTQTEVDVTTVAPSLANRSRPAESMIAGPQPKVVEVEPELIVESRDDAPLMTPNEPKHLSRALDVHGTAQPLHVDDRNRPTPNEPQRLVAPSAQPLSPRPLTLSRRKVRENAQQPIDDVALLPQQSDIEVMRQLGDLDADLAHGAEVELRRRGYRTADIPLCRALTDPDPTVRRRLADALPTMTNIDSRPWLLQLSEDSDAEVRRAADGILRTSRDPALQRRFR